MLDSKIRPLIDPPLNMVAKLLVKAGISANMLTLTGFIFACFAFACLTFELCIPALFFILLSRLMDGLDGPVARQSEYGPTDLGGFYDIVSDFIFYSGIIFFFALGRPETALAASFLIFSFIGTASTFLCYGIMAAKKNLNHNEQGEKSFFYLAGLCEGSETIIFLILMCLIPEQFVILAVLFGLLCWMTTIGRIMMARKDFSS